MTEIANPESLIAALNEPTENSVQMPNDINTAEDFIAWGRRIGSYPHTREQIQSELDRIGQDDEGRLKEDLQTASRTFLAGPDLVDVIDWLEMAFG